MPGEQDANLELDPSSGSTLDEAQAAAPAESADAGSSTAKPDGDTNDEVSALSIVRDVVRPKEEQAEAAASPAEGSETGEETGEKPPKEVDDENFTDVGFAKHPRFKKLIAQRNEAREGAKRYDAVENFLRENNLNGNEAFDTLSMVALAKTDPVSCWEKIKPWVQNLLIAAGEVPPPDLQERVSRGEITLDQALELGRMKARVASVETTTKFQQERAEEQRRYELQAQIDQTVSAWENDRTVKDPNFAAKMPAILKELKALKHDEGVPNTPLGVQDQLNRAYKAVSEAFVPPAAPAQPARRPMTPVRGGQVNGAPTPKFENTLDIIKHNVRSR